MGSEIPDIKIGTSMDYLKELVENSSDLNKRQKASIFNFIEDETKMGDGKITNEIELNMILGFFSSKKGKAKMPEVLQSDKEGVKVKRKEDDTFFVQHHSIELSQEDEESKTTDTNYANSHLLTDKIKTQRSYLVETKNGSDQVWDLDGDNVPDKREVIQITPEGGKATYIDTDADGEFDYKSVKNDKSHQSDNYYRNKKGNWEVDAW